MHLDLQTMIAEEDNAVCIGIISGTHGRPLQSIPATHRPTATRHIHVLTFNDAGLISEHLAVRDEITLLQQLGGLPDDFPRHEPTHRPRSSQGYTLGVVCRWRLAKLDKEPIRPALSLPPSATAAGSSRR